MLPLFEKLTVPATESVVPAPGPCIDPLFTKVNDPSGFGPPFDDRACDPAPNVHEPSLSLVTATLPP